MGASISGAGPSVFAWFEDRASAEAAARRDAGGVRCRGLRQPGLRLADRRAGAPNWSAHEVRQHARQAPTPSSLGAAIAAGLAPDGGLYVPESLPRLRSDGFRQHHDACRRRPAACSRPSSPTIRSHASSRRSAREAFDFRTPLLPLGDSGRFPARAVPRADRRVQGLRRALPRRAACTLADRCGTATDHPCRHLGRHRRRGGCRLPSPPGLRVVILYPDGRVSPRQAHQLGCFGDNVRAFARAGSFDDCQALAKQALSDAELAGARAAEFGQQHQPGPAAAADGLLRAGRAHPGARAAARH